MSVREKSLANARNILRKMISLLKSWIKGVKDNHNVQFSSVTKIWPVKAVSHIIFVDWTFYMFIKFLFSLESKCDVHSVYVNTFSNFHDGFHQATFIVVFQCIYDYWIVNFYAIWLYWAFKTCVEIFVWAMEDVDISIIIFAGDKIKVISMIYNIS